MTVTVCLFAGVLANPEQDQRAQEHSHTAKRQGQVHIACALSYFALHTYRVVNQHDRSAAAPMVRLAAVTAVGLGLYRVVAGHAIDSADESQPLAVRAMLMLGEYAIAWTGIELHGPTSRRLI